MLVLEERRRYETETARFGDFGADHHGPVWG